MITNLNLLRNIGRFESVSAAANIPLNRGTLVYAENGQGKTTLTAVLRSLATGDAIPIVERRRLTAANPPQVVIACSGGPPPQAMFQNGAWNRLLPNMLIFDDVFIDRNVYSGLAVGSDHRQHLHELILGAQGIQLNERLQQLIADIENHNTNLRQRGQAIPAVERGPYSVDDFCALAANANIDTEILDAERNLAAARAQNPVRTTQPFDLVSLPSIRVDQVTSILEATVSDLDSASVAKVQAHLSTVGRGGEGWIAEGMTLQAHRDENASNCLFCAQDLGSSPVFGHYRAFFSAAYRDLRQRIVQASATLESTHSGTAAATFERGFRQLIERRQFWEQFCDVPTIELDTATIVRDWQDARGKVAALLMRKQAAPLERVDVPADVRESIAAYDRHIASIEALNEQLQSANRSIAEVKQRAASANPITLENAVARLRATRSRHTAPTSALCEAYLSEARAKAATEQRRDQARTALQQYRTNVFPTYQVAINRYLALFNAGFRIDSVTAENTRGGPSCTYNVVINNVPVSIDGAPKQPGDHSFHNTLSAGDRNSLALAFFFATLDADPNLTQKIVVIDDPVSSLDDHRSLTTAHEIRRLILRTDQVIVLSHNKGFLGRIWDGVDATQRAALHVTRDGAGSTLGAWNVALDSITEHDRRHEALRSYLSSGGHNEREIARSVRPVIEAFLRVAFPENFPPGTLLGPFRGLCEQRVGTPREILNATDIQELRDIVDYANRFHHDTNPAWETETINSTELTGFVRRALDFAKRR